MLVSTLNYNQPELTDNLVKQISFNKSQYELMVVDNGSNKELAKSTTHKLPENYYFGGGINVILDYFLNKTEHEYLVIFNNDLIFHGPNLLDNMVNEMKDNDLALYSPAIINTGADQCFWKQMWNWGTGTVREVDFIDFMCPVIRRDLAEIIGQFPEELYLGWGADFYSGIIANKNELKVGVSDNISLAHLVGYTFKSNAIDIPENTFAQNADINMHKYFDNNQELKNAFHEFRRRGATYNV